MRVIYWLAIFIVLLIIEIATMGPVSYTHLTLPTN